MAKDDIVVMRKCGDMAMVCVDVREELVVFIA